MSGNKNISVHINQFVVHFKVFLFRQTIEGRKLLFLLNRFIASAIFFHLEIRCPRIQKGALFKTLNFLFIL